MHSWNQVLITKVGHPAEGTAGVVQSTTAKFEGDPAETVEVKLDIDGSVATFTPADVRILA